MIDPHPFRIEVAIDDPTALPPFETRERSYVPPAATMSNRQRKALEAALRRKARWEREPA